MMKQRHVVIHKMIVAKLGEVEACGPTCRAKNIHRGIFLTDDLVWSWDNIRVCVTNVSVLFVRVSSGDTSIADFELFVWLGMSMIMMII